MNVGFSRALPYLHGFAGACVLTWLLTWARTFVLARVSERIAVDLRNRIYGHMQSLSLEFFGGKRTGDLIARVSTDTDRICYFLSVYLLDFANDVLMLLLTAGILLVAQPLAGHGHAAAAAGDRLSGASRPQPAAARFCAGHAGMGRDDQRAGRHDPRHPRRQGLRPGDTARSSGSAPPTTACCGPTTA